MSDKPGYFVCALIIKGKAVEIRRQGSMAKPSMSVYIEGNLVGAGLRSKAECLKVAGDRMVL